MLLEIVHFWILVPKMVRPRVRPRHLVVLLIKNPVFELFFPKARVRQVGIKAALLQYRAGLMLKVTLKVGFVSHYHLALVIFFFSFSLHCINIRIV